MSHILVVEDEEFLVRALKDNLESEGYTVAVAMDGETAFTELAKKIPDLILLDLLLPKKNGFDVLKEVKENLEWKLVPVIILSNLGEDSEIKRALELGASDYFVKSQHPIQEVVDKVREYLQGKGASKAQL